MVRRKKLSSSGAGEKAALLGAGTNAAAKYSSLSQLATQSLGSLAYLLRCDERDKDDVLVLPTTNALPPVAHHISSSSNTSTSGNSNSFSNKSTRARSAKHSSGRSSNSGSLQPQAAVSRLWLPSALIREIASFLDSRGRSCMLITSANMRRAMTVTGAALSNTLLLRTKSGTSSKRRNKTALLKAFWLSTDVTADSSKLIREESLAVTMGSSVRQFQRQFHTSFVGDAAHVKLWLSIGVAVITACGIAAAVTLGCLSVLPVVAVWIICVCCVTVSGALLATLHLHQPQ
jgi:hypothetical protein